MTKRTLLHIIGFDFGATERKMRVLLVSSNLYSQFPACFPNGVGALSAYLKQEGYEVAALHMGRKSDMNRLPGVLQEFSPDVVGISAVTCETPAIAPVALMAKQWNPDVPVLAGGIHCIVSPESVLAIPEVDAVCCGEGELAFLEYLRNLETGKDVTNTPNFMFRENGKFRRTHMCTFIPDLDSLPSPDRSVADMQGIIDANNGVLNVIFSRGCPWNCRFCCNHDIRKSGEGVYTRHVSVPRAMQDLKHLTSTYNVSYILFRDDTFTWKRDWAIEFLRTYPVHFDYPFDIFARVDTLDVELIDTLKQAGCRHVFLGLDSGNDFIRNEVLNKEQTNEDLLRVVDYMKSVGVVPMVSNIVGLPYETPERFLDTIELNRYIHRDMVVFSPTCGACPKIWVFTPWPGSDLNRLCEKNGWKRQDPAGSQVYRESVLDMPEFPAQDIDRQYRLFRYLVYKESHPLHALLFLLYDSKAFQRVFERIPPEAMGLIRKTALSVLNSTERSHMLKRLARKVTAA